MQLFYAHDINGEFYSLNEEESVHCSRVLRLKKGDIVNLTDGLGNLYKAVLDKIEKRSTQVRIIEQITEFGKKNYHLHIAIAPTKSTDRFEWFLEKATEIGVDEITPLLCEHSERKQIKKERAERIVVAAMKQSVKAYKPVINELKTINEFLQGDFISEHKFIAHCYEEEKPYLKNSINKYEKYTILIGPEGDFSRDEVIRASDAGFKSVSLGESRLRTETAGVLACATINLINL